MRRRREFIAALGAATASVAGCAGLDLDDPRGRMPDGGGTTTEGSADGSIDAVPAEVRERYGTVVDVEEEGLDPGGDATIDERAAELAADDTLLFFPEGTYRVGQLDFSGRSNFGLYGDGATLELETPGPHIFLILRRVSGVHVEGFSVDNSASDTAAWCDIKCVGGTNTVRDYTVEEFVDVEERTNGFTLMVEGEDTSLELDDVDIGRGGQNGAATYVFPRRDFYDPEREPGSLTFRNCVMKGWGKEGLYASGHSGPLRVIGGEYANNAIVQVRVGGGDAPTRAVVRDVTVRVTSIPDYMPEDNRILRGIWLKEGDVATVEDCRIEVRNVGRNETQAGIIVNEQFGRATIRNCHIRMDVERPAVLVDAPEDEFDPDLMPSLSSLPPEWGVVCEGVTIEGQSPNTEAIAVYRRSECEFRDVTVDTDRRTSDGMRFYGVPSSRVENSAVDVGRFPIAVGFPEDPEPCAFRLSNVDIRGEHLSDRGSDLVRGEDGGFCLGQAVVPSDRSASDSVLALTQTENPTAGGSNLESDAASNENGRTGSDRDRPVLYGRWLDEW